jgi:cation diffusion facilitator CzcD-associated flavoprotein CzcO
VLDIPAHTYQLTFEPNYEWPQFYAKSTDIYKYWKKVAAKYNCMRYIKLEHQVVEARWSTEESKWHLKVCCTSFSADYSLSRGCLANETALD